MPLDRAAAAEAAQLVLAFQGASLSARRVFLRALVLKAQGRMASLWPAARAAAYQEWVSGLVRRRPVGLAYDHPFFFADLFAAAVEDCANPEKPYAA
jgi:hypothetical protein